MRLFLFYFLLAMTLQTQVIADEKLKTTTFRLSLSSEPASLKLWQQKNYNSNFLFNQIFGTLLRFHNGQLIPELAEKCFYKNDLTIECLISKTTTWSDGSPILAADFVRAYQEFVKPENNAFLADRFFPIKNAEKIFQGKLPISDLGVKVQDQKLIIELEKKDPEFIYSLSSFIFAPLKSLPLPDLKQAEQMITSGFYKIHSWEPQKKITLQKVSAQKSGPTRVEFFFIRDETTALRMYQNKQLDFLRRLPTLNIEKIRKQPDYFEFEQTRLDYIGFGPKLKDHPELRKALAWSLNYSELTKILSSKGDYGCPGLPQKLYGKVNCTPFQLKEAKQQLQLAKDKGPLPQLDFILAKNVEDHKRVAEWMQLQWKKNLGLDIKIEFIDSKLFVERFQKRPPAIFRRGNSPLYPTCRSALYVFSEKALDQFIKIEDTNWEEKIANIQTPQECSSALQFLIDNSHVIFTGPIYFSVLANPAFKGQWHLNELNQFYIR
jgi:oligopeptide transport system substrate-binding protein